MQCSEGWAQSGRRWGGRRRHLAHDRVDCGALEHAHARALIQFGRATAHEWENARPLLFCSVLYSNSDGATRHTSYRRPPSPLESSRDRRSSSTKRLKRNGPRGAQICGCGPRAARRRAHCARPLLSLCAAQRRAPPLQHTISRDAVVELLLKIA